MKNPSISIIVPVYNVELYIEKCIESVLNQTIDDYELIIINDGSIDNSGLICQEYAKKSNKIKYFDQKNGGVSLARNIGLENAIGKYICFLDSDDTIENNAVFELLKFIEKYNSIEIDILQFGYTTISENSSKYTIPKFSKIYASEEYFNTNICSPGICGNLIKRELIEGLRFLNGIKVAEDIEFMVKVFSKANIIGSVDKSLYNYLIRENSATTSTINASKALDHLKVAVSLIYYVKNEKIVKYARGFVYKWIGHLFKGYFYTIAKMKDVNEANKAMENYYLYRTIYLRNVPFEIQIKELPIIIANINTRIFLFILKHVRKINSK